MSDFYLQLFLPKLNGGKLVYRLNFEILGFSFEFSIKTKIFTKITKVRGKFGLRDI